MTPIPAPSGASDGVPPDWQALAGAQLRADLSMAALHLRYAVLGGSAPLHLLTEYFTTGDGLPSREHDFAVLALNERFLELDLQERLPYTC